MQFKKITNIHKSYIINTGFEQRNTGCEKLTCVPIRKFLISSKVIFKSRVLNIVFFLF